MIRRCFHEAETRGKLLVRTSYQHTAGGQHPEDRFQRSFLFRGPVIRQQIVPEKNHVKPGGGRRMFRDVVVIEPGPLVEKWFDGIALLSAHLIEISIDIHPPQWFRISRMTGSVRSI